VVCDKFGKWKTESRPLKLVFGGQTLHCQQQSLIHYFLYTSESPHGSSLLVGSVPSSVEDGSGESLSCIDLASFPGCRRNGLETSVLLPLPESWQCQSNFRVLSQTTVKPNCVIELLQSSPSISIAIVQLH